MLQEAITSPYVDYNYYSETYGGNKIPQDSFDACEKRAEAVLHRISFDRVKRLPEIPDMVKDAICAMAEIDYQEEKKTPGKVGKFRWVRCHLRRFRKYNRSIWQSGFNVSGGQHLPGKYRLIIQRSIEKV